MKKSIGLTADVSTFNTTLPQTRHLNYFMNTNPRGFANGGDVKAGIPNYPNPNVTSGFLPMALGFAPGGEVDNFDFIKNLLKKFDNDFTKLLKFLQNILGYSQEEAESIIDKIQTQDAESPSGPSQEVFDREEEIKGLETPKKPVTPKDTVTATPEPITTRSDRQGSFDNVPLPPLPKISTEQQQREFEDSQKPIEPKPQITSPDNGGITTIKPEKIEPEKSESTNRFDVNGDGVVNFKDLWEAIRLGMGTEFIEELRQFIEGFKGKEKPDEGEKIVPDSPEKIVPDSPEKIVPEKIVPDSPEKIVPEKIVPETPEKIVPDTPEKIVPKPKPDKDGITELPKVSEEQERRDEQDKRTGLSVEDQKTLKLAANINEGGDGGIETLKNKKDVPAWALPMMSAGFAMMASKSPYFMQALGEAGQAGVESYTAQKTAEEDKLDKESARDLQEAQAAYYRGEGRQSAGTMKIIDGVYHRLNTKTGNFDKVYLEDGKTPAKVIIGRQDAIDYLMNKDPLWNSYDYDTKEQKIKEYVDMINGTYEQIIKKKEAEGDGTFNILDLPKNIFNFIEGFTAKDGGIVSLRR